MLPVCAYSFMSTTVYCFFSSLISLTYMGTLQSVTQYLKHRLSTQIRNSSENAHFLIELGLEYIYGMYRNSGPRCDIILTLRQCSSACPQTTHSPLSPCAVVLKVMARKKNEPLAAEQHCISTDCESFILTRATIFTCLPYRACHDFFF